MADSNLEKIKYNQRGFSLIEIMVSLVISSLVMLVMISILDLLNTGVKTESQRIDRDFVYRQVHTLFLDPQVCRQAVRENPQDISGDNTKSLTIYFPDMSVPKTNPESRLFFKGQKFPIESNVKRAEVASILVKSDVQLGSLRKAIIQFNMVNLLKNKGESFEVRMDKVFELYYVWDDKLKAMTSCGLTPALETFYPPNTDKSVEGTCKANEDCLGVPTMCLRPQRRKSTCTSELGPEFAGTYCKILPPWITESNESLIDRIYFCPAGKEKVYLNADAGDPLTAKYSRKCKVSGPGNPKSSKQASWVVLVGSYLYNCTGGITNIQSGKPNSIN